jgi:hypothetical protein
MVPLPTRERVCRLVVNDQVDAERLTPVMQRLQ